MLEFVGGGVVATFLGWGVKPPLTDVYEPDYICFPVSCLVTSVNEGVYYTFGLASPKSHIFILNCRSDRMF